MAAEIEAIFEGYAAWNRDDLDGWLAVMHPDVELSSAGIFPGLNDRYYGHEGLAEFWHQIREPWESFRIDVQRIDQHPEGAVVDIRFRAKGRGSGVDVDMRFGHALRIREARATEIITRGSVEEAAEALRGPTR